ncbi:diflavin oxidoreductase [Marinagarivorans algicola]|uniref:diflavin oxidoreductase n=1 Tax=Marinagarivorans algicola TaxID=1513270 RepID=UPI0006B60CE5|nr:sulfite reductase flavoprotein subunit alpha [Marinagarivorans algicola]
MSEETKNMAEKNIVNQLAAAIGATHAKAPAAFLDETAPFEGEQKTWLNGLLTGLNAIAMAAQGDTGDVPGTAMSILYGSQSGNAEALSKGLRKFAKTQGFDAAVSELDGVDPQDLAQMKHVLIICSTFGEGEPPDNAQAFYNTLMSDNAPRLSADVNFSVCGLGDSSYAFFNQCAKDIDARLEALGATRVHALASCDVAFEDDFAHWQKAAFASEAFMHAAGAASGTVEPEVGPKFDKNSPFLATLMVTENLSGPKSAKRVNHIEISLAGGTDELDYAVGDALGVWPVNCAKEVQALLDTLHFSGRESVQLKAGPASLRAALLTQLDITTVNAKTLETWGVEPLGHDAQVIDVLRAVDKPLAAQTFVDGLRLLQPRLYSIASSPKAHPGEVHLTVGQVHYTLHNTARKGVASTFLGERLGAGSTVGVYLQRSAHFHLPVDDNAPLMMIGPGTGIAPFRAFLEEREARQAPGKNWLFFGDQHEQHDYLYRNQIQHWQNAGILDRLSLAWSRDTAEKVYVQTLIMAQGAEFFAWLEAGGYVYICGDATRMAADVDAAIRAVIAQHGHRDPAAVDDYMKRLIAEHRYQRDVY